MNRHASRGQALVETAIAMPLFLLAFFGLLWVMRESSLLNQVQLGVRYGGMIGSQAEPYASFSLYDVYATIDNAQPAAAQTCASGATSAVGAGERPFWQPAAVTAPIITCPTALSLLTGPETYTQPVLLRDDYANLRAQVPVDGYLSRMALQASGGSTTVQAEQNFFRAPDVGTLLNCSTLGSAVKASLEGATDSTTPTTVASPLPTTPTAATVTTGTTSACATRTYASPATPY